MELDAIAGFARLVIDEQVNFVVFRQGLALELGQLVFGVLAHLVADVRVNCDLHITFFDGSDLCAFSRSPWARELAGQPDARATSPSEYPQARLCGKGSWCAATRRSAITEMGIENGGPARRHRAPTGGRIVAKPVCSRSTPSPRPSSWSGARQQYPYESNTTAGAASVNVQGRRAQVR